MLDGAPIVVIVTGLNGSNNVKTGATVQTWIIRDDISPMDAINSGKDSSICGDCVHRGDIVDGKNKGRSCYVAAWQAPTNIFKTMKAGKYSFPSMSEAIDLVAGKMVRLGAYGDPAAVPFHIWQSFLSKAAAFTGYTHQWRNIPADFSKYCMASADTLQDYNDAKALGYRVFRVKTATTTKLSTEVTCPASKEAGQKTICALCKACGGTSSKAKVDIVIDVHGASGKIQAYNRALQAA